MIGQFGLTAVRLSSRCPCVDPELRADNRWWVDPLSVWRLITQQQNGDPITYCMYVGDTVLTEIKIGVPSGSVSQASNSVSGRDLSLLVSLPLPLPHPLE